MIEIANNIDPEEDIGVQSDSSSDDSSSESSDNSYDSSDSESFKSSEKEDSDDDNEEDRRHFTKSLKQNRSRIQRCLVCHVNLCPQCDNIFHGADLSTFPL